MKEHGAESARYIGTRWVLTDKRTRSEAAKKPHEVVAKARLAVQGHMEFDNDIRSHSPTASLLAFNVVASVAAMNAWPVRKADATNAYLQSGKITRLLLLRPPDPVPHRRCSR